jgi:hypothetical protein
VTISASNLSEHRRALQDALARRSTRGRHIVAHASGHWIPLDEPGTVVEAVREMVEQIRSRST